MIVRLDRIPIAFRKSKGSSPDSSAAMQRLLGGTFGEKSILPSYTFRSFNVRGLKPLRSFYDLLANNAVEEYSPIETLSDTIGLRLTAATEQGTEPDTRPLADAKDARTSYRVLDSGQERETRVQIRCGAEKLLRWIARRAAGRHRETIGFPGWRGAAPLPEEETAPRPVPRSTLTSRDDPGMSSGVSNDRHQMGATTMATRRQRYLWNLVMAGLGMFAASGRLFAQGQDAGAQGRTDQGQEAQMLVAHGLAMAIEGSTLEALALRRGGGVIGAVPTSPIGPGVGGSSTGTGLGGTGTGPIGGGAVGTAAGGTPGTATREPYGSGAGTRAAGTSGPGGGGAVGTGAGGAGGTVSREPYGSDAGTRRTSPGGPGGGGAVGTGAGGAGGTVSREPSGRADETRGTVGPSGTAAPSGAGAPNAAGLAEGSRASLDPSAMELHRHAKRAFDASDRLIREASQGGNAGPASRFQVAAIRYATTLRLLSEQNDAIGITPVLVLNHGVKESLDSLELSQLVRMMGPADSPAGRALLTHAREMEAESLQAVEGVLSASSPGSRDGANAPVTTGLEGGQAVPIRTLALQASEVVMAIQELTGGRQPAGKGK